MQEKTLSIIKPDAMKRQLIGKIISCFEEKGLQIVAARMKHLSRSEAEGFYAEHRQRPFFGELVESMSSGPVLLMVLAGENAIQRNREIMGSTNPSQAAEGTIRKRFGLSVGENSVHGSDSPDSARRELNYFFPSIEIF